MNEADFLAEMVANPNDPTPRLVMADWLEERGDPRAELMRIQEQLRSIDVPKRKEIEARMQQLLREGVEPVVARRTNSLGMRFVFVLPGEFMMGETEKQKHVVIDEGFWLGETCVTQDQWQEVMHSQLWADKANVKQDDDCPATYVNWDDGMEFCSRLSERESLVSEHYTLPVEAQWEYACRAGTTSDFSFGDDEAEMERYGWFKENARDAGEEYAHQIGQKLPNPWGQFDVHGNVWEWCHDRYDKEGPPRVCRGGSWYFNGRLCGSANRYRVDPSNRNSLLGFRVASVPSSQPSKRPESGAESEGR